MRIKECVNIKCRINVTFKIKLLMSRSWTIFAYCNCFLAPTKRYSGILRTVESYRRQLQDLLPLCRLRTRPLLFRRSVCLFILCSQSSCFPTLSRWHVLSFFSAAHQPLSLLVFPRFSLRDPVTMIKRIRRLSRISLKGHPSFLKKARFFPLLLSLPPSHSTLSSHRLH